MEVEEKEECSGTNPEVDIYEDLDVFGLKDGNSEEESEEEVKDDEDGSASRACGLTADDILQLQKQVRVLTELNHELAEEKLRLQTNLSSAIKTARAEVNRKNQQIADLEREVQDVIFRRACKNGSGEEVAQVLAKFRAAAAEEPDAARLDVPGGDKKQAEGDDVVCVKYFKPARQQQLRTFVMGKTSISFVQQANEENHEQKDFTSVDLLRAENTDKKSCVGGVREPCDRTQHPSGDETRAAAADDDANAAAAAQRNKKRNTTLRAAAAAADDDERRLRGPAADRAADKREAEKEPRTAEKSMTQRERRLRNPSGHKDRSEKRSSGGNDERKQVEADGDAGKAAQSAENQTQRELSDEQNRNDTKKRSGRFVSKKPIVVKTAEEKENASKVKAAEKSFQHEAVVDGNEEEDRLSDKVTNTNAKELKMHGEDKDKANGETAEINNAKASKEREKTIINKKRRETEAVKKSEIEKVKTTRQENKAESPRAEEAQRNPSSASGFRIPKRNREQTDMDKSSKDVTKKASVSDVRKEHVKSRTSKNMPDGIKRERCGTEFQVEKITGSKDVNDDAGRSLLDYKRDFEERNRLCKELEELEEEARGISVGAASANESNANDGDIAAGNDGEAKRQRLDVRPSEPPLDARPSEPPLDARPSEPPLDARPSEPPLDARPSEPPLDARPSEPPLDARPSEPPPPLDARPSEPPPPLQPPERRGGQPQAQVEEKMAALHQSPPPPTKCANQQSKPQQTNRIQDYVQDDNNLEFSVTQDDATFMEERSSSARDGNSPREIANILKASLVPAGARSRVHDVAVVARDHRATEHIANVQAKNKNPPSRQPGVWKRLGRKSAGQPEERSRRRRSDDQQTSSSQPLRRSPRKAKPSERVRCSSAVATISTNAARNQSSRRRRKSPAPAPPRRRAVADLRDDSLAAAAAAACRSDEQQRLRGRNGGGATERPSSGGRAAGKASSPEEEPPLLPPNRGQCRKLHRAGSLSSLLALVNSAASPHGGQAQSAQLSAVRRKTAALANPEAAQAATMKDALENLFGSDADDDEEEGEIRDDDNPEGSADEGRALNEQSQPQRPKMSTISSSR